MRRTKRARRVFGDSPELMRLLRTEVIPILERLELGAFIAPATLDATLRKFEERARVLAARNFQEWQETTVPVLLASPEILEVTRLTSQLMARLVESPLTFASIRDSQGTAIHFYFDIAALLGQITLRPQIVPAALMLLRRSIPRYRAIDARERYAPLEWRGVPSDVATALLVAGAVERVADPNGVFLKEDFTLLLHLLSGWELSPASAAKVLLREQIETGLCPQLSGLVARLPVGPRFSQSILLVVVSLLDLCRPYMLMARRTQVREGILRRLIGDDAGIPDSRGVSAVDFLLNESTLWYAGFSPSTSVSRRYVIAEKALRDFIAARVTWSPKAGRLVVPRFLGGAGKDPVGFGRALGLAIVEGVNLHSLNLDIALIGFMHPSIRVSAPDLDEVRGLIAPTTVGEMRGILHGLQDILCCGGFEMFSASEWLALFGHVE